MEDAEDILHTAVCTLDGSWEPNLKDFCSHKSMVIVSILTNAPQASKFEHVLHKGEFEVGGGEAVCMLLSCSSALVSHAPLTRCNHLVDHRAIACPSCSIVSRAYNCKSLIVAVYHHVKVLT